MRTSSQRPRRWLIVSALGALAVSWIAVAAITPAAVATTPPLGGAANVVGWGLNDRGQAGLSGGVVQVAAFGNHSLALKSDGTVAGWGYDYYGQATPPATLSGVTQIAAGAYHSLALKSDGTVVAWGNGDADQLKVPAGLTNVTQITAGLNHSLALKSDGTVIAWGWNDNGQSSVPAGLSNVAQVAAGADFSLALKKDGTVIGWGANWDGQASPPAGLANITQIAAGWNHSLALKSDGTVIGWGANLDGQASPPAGLTNITQIAAGGNHSLALKSDGTVVGWGRNDSGQATPPAGLSGVTQIAAGGQHSLALVADTTPPDTTPPETTIDFGPSETVTSASAAFSFSSEVGATFECRLDGAPFTACASPQSYTGLADGAHTFEVRAKDAAGNLDATPASRTWTVDTTAPDTTITSGPSGALSSASATFTFSSETGATFECSLDGASFTACDSPKDYTGLAEGAHTFAVRAEDAAGNLDATPASRTWTVDTTAPETTITSGPSGTVSSGWAKFLFSSEAGATFECSLDAAPFTACASPKSYSGLAEGAHTFAVRAKDAAGNLDATPASRTWTVDTAPPDTSITVGPITPSTQSTSATFTFSGTDNIAPSGSLTFECQLDSGLFASCSSPKTYTGLALGSHAFSVRAKDAAGNVDPTPATYNWEIHAMTTSVYNGAQIVTQGSNVVLGAKLSCTAAACVAGKTLTFSTDDNPTTAAADDGTYVVGSAVTDASGQANLKITTTGWLEGVYTIHIAFAGTSSCDASDDDATLVVSVPGESANGGGWYTLPGSGRVNLGFVVSRLPNATPTQYKGQFLLINNGKWRIKGQLDIYTKITTGTIKINGGGTVTCSSTKPCGSASGTGSLYSWEATANGGVGAWIKTADSPVRYTITFVDSGSGGKNSADRFGVSISHTIVTGQPSTLPNSLPELLKGGDIKIN